VAIPNAALASPGRRDHLAYRRRQFVVAMFVLTGTIVAILSVVDLAGGSTAVDSLSRSAVVRGILVSLAGLGLFVATLGRMAAVSWRRNDSSENPIVAVLLGTALGVCLPIIAGLVAGVSPELLFLVPGLFALAGLGLLLLWWVYGLVEPARSFRETLPTLLSALCVVGTLAVGVDIGDSLALGLSGVGGTLTFAAGLFIYSVGRYGTTLADEIPTGEVERMPQLVQIAYAGGVVALGGVLAIGGFALAMGLSPQFSFAALIGLVAAFLALIALVTVLRSRDGTPVS